MNAIVGSRGGVRGEGGLHGKQQNVLTSDAQAFSSKMEDSEYLFPPANFATVEAGLYRSSFPSTKNFSFLKKLKLKTILYVYIYHYSSVVIAHDVQCSKCMNNAPVSFLPDTLMTASIFFKLQNTGR